MIDHDMDPRFLNFLSEMAQDILTIFGVAYLQLIVLIVFRAGCLRRLNEENMTKRLGHLCFNTIKSQIQNKIRVTTALLW